MKKELPCYVYFFVVYIMSFIALLNYKLLFLLELVSVVLNKKRDDLLPEDIPLKLQKSDTLLNMVQNTRVRILNVSAFRLAKVKVKLRIL